MPYFIFENVPQATVAITLPLFWIFFGVAPADTVFAPWTQYIPWYVLGGVVMAVVLEDTGLLKRIAFFCIEKVGCTYNLDTKNSFICISYMPLHGIKNKISGIPIVVRFFAQSTFVHLPLPKSIDIVTHSFLFDSNVAIAYTFI